MVQSKYSIRKFIRNTCTWVCADIMSHMNDWNHVKCKWARIYVEHIIWMSHGLTEWATDACCEIIAQHVWVVPLLSRHIIWVSRANKPLMCLMEMWLVCAMDMSVTFDIWHLFGVICSYTCVCVCACACMCVCMWASKYVILVKQVNVLKCMSAY